MTSSEIASLAAKQKWDHKKEAVVQEAILEWPVVKNNPELMGFLGLYWGEGDKRSSYVGIVNTDPGIIVASFKMFRQLSPGCKIEVMIRCYPEHDASECKIFWQNLLGVQAKTKDKDWLGKKRGGCKYGVCTIRYSDWKIKHKILAWLGLWRNDLTGSGSAW